MNRFEALTDFDHCPLGFLEHEVTVFGYNGGANLMLAAILVCMMYLQSVVNCINAKC